VVKLRLRVPPKWAASVAIVFLVSLGTASIALANLPGSSFEGGDGNLTPDTAGNTDWSNVAGLNVGIDLPSGPTDNAFGQGTKEDNAAVTVVSGSIPPNKSDLTRFYEASEFRNGSNFLYLAWERTNVLGSANMDFEINQAGTPGLGLPGAHTINRTAGDLLVTYDFANGGSSPTLGLLFWVTTGSTGQCFSSNSLPCWGNHVNLNSTNSEGAINAVTVIDPIAPNAPRSLPAFTFGETAINLTGAGVFPPGVCEAFGSAFLKSRSSTSFSAEVKDFVAPIAVNISNCGTITIHKVTENGDASFGYTTTGTLSPATFNLSNGGTQAYTGVQVGQYSVTESTPPAGWTLKSLVCGTVTGTGTAVTISGATVSISMQPSGNVDCTYTNHINLSPTLTTLLSATSTSIGTPVHDSATLTGATANAGGTVTYKVYTDTGCTQGAVAAGTVTVVNGSVPDSNAITFNSAGTFYWQAAYSGDANNNPATSSCLSERLIVNPNPTSIATKLAPASPVSIGTAVHDTATLTGATANAGGTVTYTVYTDNACSLGAESAGTVTVSGGIVPNSNAITFNNAGSFFWQAVYSGDSNNVGSTSSCTSEPLIVNPNLTSINTSLVPSSPVSIGTAVHDTATLVGATGTAGGTVTYTVYTDTACSLGAVSAGTVTVTNGIVLDSNPITFNNAGSFFWQAVYSGDGNNVGSTSPCASEPLIVNPNVTAINTNLVPSSPVSIGTAVHDTASLTGATATAGGTVTYTVYTDNACTKGALAAGTVTVTGNSVPDSNTITFNNAGSFWWQAVYNGDANNLGSTSSCASEPLVINPNTPAMTTAPNLIPNDVAGITGATGNAGGTITFNLYAPSDATCSGTPALTQTVNVSGNGSYSTSNSTFVAGTLGTWRWQVVYSGDFNNVGTTSACGVESFTLTNGS